VTVGRSWQTIPTPCAPTCTGWPSWRNWRGWFRRRIALACNTGSLRLAKRSVKHAGANSRHWSDRRCDYGSYVRTLMASCVAPEMEPPAFSPVSIDRRTVSPTTRPTPASRMHGWPAVADLTLGRPIRIALAQVGTAPKAPAHFKLSQQISQRSDPFLCCLKPRSAPIA
jgi:hypothetical protein